MSSSKISKRRAWFALAGLLVLAIVGIASFGRLRTQYSIMQFLPAKHPALLMDQAIRKRFSLIDHPTYIGLVRMDDSETGSWLDKGRVEQLKRATETISKWPGVTNAVSLGTVEGLGGSKETLSVGRLADIVPKFSWRKRILGDRLLTPTLVSKDTRSALIYIELRDADVNLLTETQTKFGELLKSEFPSSQTYLGGVPAVQTDLGLLLSHELTNFLLLTIVACAVTLLLVFRSISTIFIPLILTIFANIVVVAAMAWVGLPFTILSSTIPILVFITVVSLSVHTLLRVKEDLLHLPKAPSKWKHLVRASRAVFLPNLLGAFTTCVGFLTLLLGQVPLIREYGIGVAMAVMISWVLTTVSILPLMELFPLPEPRSWVQKPARWALWIIQNKKSVVASTAAICAALVIVGRQLHWTGRLFDDLPKGQPARTSTENIDRSMGGVLPLELELTLPEKEAWNDHEKVAELDTLLESLRKVPGVGSIQGLPDFVRAASLQPSKTSEHRLPASNASLGETYFLYSMASPNPLDQFLANGNRSTRIGIKLHDLPSDQLSDTTTKIEDAIHAAFPDGKLRAGGMGAYSHLVNDELSRELIFGFWQALGIIVVMLTLIFRSLRWALIACVPNLVPPIALLGYLSLTHEPIKPGVAIIFSIALGLAFNNTVYALNRFKTLRKAGVPRPIAKTFYLEGNPCLVSTLIIMAGFSVFIFSYFPLNKTFGACMLISIAGGILGDLVFLPAFLTLLPKKVLE